jgi:ribosomal protein L19
MAKDKKGFILYCDLQYTINKLTDEQAGKLFKHILSYVNDEDPIAEDLITEIAFEPIKQQLKRDLVKFEDTKVKRSEAGKAGANKRWQTEANDSKRIQTITKIAVKDNVKVKEKVKDNNNNTFNFYDSMVSFGFEEQLVKDWIQVRKVKKATNTETAFNGFIREVNKNENTPNFILKNCVERNWSGFKSEWLPKEQTADNTFCWR